MLCISCTGKSSSQRLREVEFTAQENQNNIAEVSHRVNALENRMDSLSGEVKQMDARTYEVRNKAGRKTGMTAHAVIPPAPPASSPAAVTPAPHTAGATPVPTAPIPTPQDTTATGQAAVMVPVLEGTATPQRPRAPLPSMDTVPPPMPLPGQQQATRGNASPALSLPPVQASPATDAAQASPAVVAPVQSMPVVTPPAAPTTASRYPVVQPTPAPQAATAPAAPAPPVDSLALPPEGVTAATAAQAMTPAATRSAKASSGVEPARLPSSAKGEEGAYKAALSLVMSGKAAQGREKFNEFLQSYPSGRFAANAHYWIGESYYSQGNYPEALMAFKQVSTQFPRHHKTADALLKAGMTYQKLGDKENAQLQFKALQADFPNSEAAGRIRRSGR